MSARFYFRNAEAPFDETAGLLSADLTPNIREVFCDRINHDDCPYGTTAINQSLTLASVIICLNRISQSFLPQTQGENSYIYVFTYLFL